MKFPPLSLSLLLASLATSPALAAVPQPVAAFLDQHCTECHDSDVKKAGLDLTDLKFDLADADAALKWQRIFERVHTGEMPPAKNTQPTKTEAELFLASLGKPLIQADEQDIASNGRVRSRRLTRTEYEHTLHDLLGIDLPLKDLLPAERGAHGFETVAEAQQLSQHQLARYLDVADLALTEAFKRALDGDTVFKKFCPPEELPINDRGNFRGPELRKGESVSWPMTLQFVGRMPVTAAPADGWYRITLKDVRALNAGPVGSVWGTLRSGRCISSIPMLYMIGLVEATKQPRDLVFEAWMYEGNMLELKPNDATLRRVAPGGKGGNVSYKGRDLVKDGFSGIAHRGIHMERIYPTADRATVRRHLLGQGDFKKLEADKTASLDRLVAQFARRAFRRPLKASQLAAYSNIGHQMLAEGASLTEGLRASYRAILCSPRFLTLIEAPGALDDYAIASRLSYALWVSMPDSQLMKLAAAGEMKKPEVIAQQVDRLLNDPKSGRFIRSFTDQWLKLKEIDFTSPDTRQFSTFDPVVQESMVQETRAYFREVVSNDLSITHLVDSDFAMLNGRLARHYGSKEPLPPGQGLQKVMLSQSDLKGRGGLVTQGSILKVTADGTHTSPVVRGVFINERILGTHIPPPPPGIPAIEPDIRGATSIRDQLEKHRSNSSCASCHMTIDPPGFALENYDPVGIWRKGYGKSGKGAPVNPSGVTPDGDAFADLQAWKQIYTRRSDELAAGFARQFITYSTGASVRFSEKDTVDEIVTQAGKSGHGLRSIISAVVTSPVFLHK
ncbi:cytochrome c [Prosthecobacter fusiformis]|uniref:Cytochrome c n=1 Tax=Prosthecobacter fusiformis TaxID=48464 RepID=A0A4R7SNY7_9BACT|nr:DUF1592 domain-containing protein [Prosthecobacter fusiformis]TDU80910.1 cytochrome c [Prosthecobacter fusiformis]